MKALILTGFGINCEEEMAAAYKLAGGQSDIVHLNDVLNGVCSIHDYDIINFPGGFSFGDDLGSGKVLSNKIKFKRLSNLKTLIDELKIFLNDGKYILGICNGFQMLVKMGILPNTECSNEFKQEVTLTRNDGGTFINKWSLCHVTPQNNSPFLKGLEKIWLPIRHGEGKLVARDENVLKKLTQKQHCCLTYEENPNGSVLNCAGLTNATGQVLGMMPHPEAFLTLYNHPDWAHMKRENPHLSDEGDGLKIFKNIVRHIDEKLLAKRKS